MVVSLYACATSDTCTDPALQAEGGKSLQKVGKAPARR